MRELFVIEVETCENVDGSVIHERLTLTLRDLHETRFISCFDAMRLPEGASYSIKAPS